MSDIINISDDSYSPDKSPPGLLTKAEFAEINSVLGSPVMPSSSADYLPQRLDRPSFVADDIPTYLTSGSTKRISSPLSARTSEHSPSFSGDDFGDMPPLLSQLRGFPKENTLKAGKRRCFSKADAHVSPHKTPELDGMFSETKPVMLPPDVTSVGHAEKIVVATLDTSRVKSRLHDRRITTTTSAIGPCPQPSSNQYSPSSPQANCPRINPPLPNFHVTDYTATSNAIQDSSEAPKAQYTANKDTMLETPSNWTANAHTLSVDEMKEFRKLVVNTRRSEGLAQNQLSSILHESNPDHYIITPKTVQYFEDHDYSDAHMLSLYPVFKRWTDGRHRLHSSLSPARLRHIRRCPRANKGASRQRSID